MNLHYFEDASLGQQEFLSKLALDSNAYYGYRTLSDEDAIKVFFISEESFKNGLFRVMIVEGIVIGFYGLVKKEMNTLSHMFVKPEFIGKGYGKILFKEALRAAKQELKWEALMWESDPHSAWFYRRMGAKQIGENICPLNPAYKSPLFVIIF